MVFLPGVETVLDLLVETYPLALITNGSPEMQRAKLETLEIRSRANRHLNLNVVGVLGQGEQEGITTILRSVELEFVEEVVDIDVLEALWWRECPLSICPMQTDR